MKLGIDVDGVLADFNTAFIERIIAITGKDLFPPRPFDIPVWDYPQYYGYTEAEISAVWARIKADSYFWARLPVYPDTHDVLKLLARRYSGDDIYFITSRPGIYAKQQTETWLRIHECYDRPTVLISGAKGLCADALGLDKYIDDHWENCVDVARLGTTQTYLLSRPWNAEYDPVPSTAPGAIIRVSVLSEMFL